MSFIYYIIAFFAGGVMLGLILFICILYVIIKIFFKIFKKGRKKVILKNQSSESEYNTNDTASIKSLDNKDITIQNKTYEDNNIIEVNRKKSLKLGKKKGTQWTKIASRNNINDNYLNAKYKQNTKNINGKLYVNLNPNSGSLKGSNSNETYTLRQIYDMRYGTGEKLYKFIALGKSLPCDTLEKKKIINHFLEQSDYDYAAPKEWQEIVSDYFDLFTLIYKQKKIVQKRLEVDSNFPMPENRLPLELLEQSPLWPKYPIQDDYVRKLFSSYGAKLRDVSEIPSAKYSKIYIDDRRKNGKYGGPYVILDEDGRYSFQTIKELENYINSSKSSFGDLLITITRIISMWYMDQIVDLDNCIHSSSGFNTAGMYGMFSININGFIGVYDYIRYPWYMDDVTSIPSYYRKSTLMYNLTPERNEKGHYLFNVNRLVEYLNGTLQPEKEYIDKCNEREKIDKQFNSLSILERKFFLENIYSSEYDSEKQYNLKKEFVELNDIYERIQYIKRNGLTNRVALKYFGDNEVWVEKGLAKCIGIYIELC